MNYTELQENTIPETLSFLLARCPAAACTNISEASYLPQSPGKCCQKQVVQGFATRVLFFFFSDVDKLMDDVGLD